jgi:adenylate cyclase
MTQPLADRLRERGVAEEEIQAAEAAGTLRLLAVEHLVLPGPPRYEGDEVAARTGLPRALTQRFWRALGFPDVGEGEVAFTEADLEVVATLASMFERKVVRPEVALQITRVLASSAARVAEAQVEGLIEPTPDGDDRSFELEAEALGSTPRFFDHVWRRQLQAAARRARYRLSPGGTAPVAVGFADLVGFTALSSTLDDDELADVVDRFTVLAYDRVALAGGRVVKTVGDEVMFVIDDLAAGAELALELAEAYAHDNDLPDVRVGLAWGPALSRDGDLFGPTVNLAARIVAIARPRSVVAADAVHEALADRPGLLWRGLRPRRLKGIGRVTLWALRRSPED